LRRYMKDFCLGWLHPFQLYLFLSLSYKHTHTYTHTIEHRTSREMCWLPKGPTARKKESFAPPKLDSVSVWIWPSWAKVMFLKNDPLLDIYMTLNDLFKCHDLSDCFSSLQTV
jgi:hypothetical protein